MNTQSKIKITLNSLQSLHESLWVQSGKEHAKTLKEFNALVVKANKILQAEKMPDGSKLHTSNYNGYELLALNEYISA